VAVRQGCDRAARPVCPGGGKGRGRHPVRHRGQARQDVLAGTDTSMSSPTTLEWMGVLAQVTQQFTIALGASIIDGIKAQIALMVANQTYVVRPTAIYVNPILADLIDQEAKASHIELKTL